MPDILASSQQLPVQDDLSLHVRRFRAEAGGPAVLMVHGLVEDGRIFYSHSGKGLAPYLAEAGYDVFVVDLRGHGESVPALMPGMQVTQHQIITEDLPALFALMEQEHPGERFYGFSHSWGGVLLACALIRHPEWIERVAGLVHFGCKRVIHQRSLRKRIMIDLLWNRAAPLVGRAKGLIPARSLGIGSMDISCALHRDNVVWMGSSEWRDLEDGFDYALALDALAWPAGMYLAGGNDPYLGHFEDVKAFAQELGEHDAQMVLLKKGTGCSRNYGHIDLLTHPQAVVDHFPMVLSWLEQHV
ncbi:MAG TPA: alpha/beta fold hydrolase [Pseudomonas xinjiangensis]|uniref:Alpha/beta fold hydrolase n=2 Tax=root TaxID=1 RepID=A0A7V1BPR5_9GAMM|nr:alpha/beta fold hydrolase [Halopseudomonas xinjiangensis]HEC49339.1 alpha/beta fold hydrolase [Halopseudomonas xinjiangensis]